MSVPFSKKTVANLSASAATVALPFVAAYGAFTPKWRATLAERFGFGGWTDAHKLREPIWCHAASVGEVGGMIPVYRALKAAHPEYSLLATVTSATGHKAVLDAGLVDACAMLPFDHPWCIKRALSDSKPRLLVISETEIWPNLLLSLDRSGVPIHFINARISDYSFSRYQAFDWLLRPILQSVTCIQAQTSLDAERFVLLGADPRAVEVAGSTKYDQPPVEFSAAELSSFADSLGLDRRAPIFVAGSVRPGEEESVIRAYLLAVQQVPKLQLIIAPRHPERFGPVGELLASNGISFRRRTAESTAPAIKVVLLDSIGELRKVYRLATVAFVGGSLVNIGGHNPLEPAACSVPVIVGPYTNNVRDAVDSLKKAGAHLLVHSADELARYVTRLCIEDDLQAGLGALSYRVWESNSGATQRVMQKIEETLETNSSYSSSRSLPLR